MAIFCTIISPDFLPFACCLRASIENHIPGAVLHVLSTGDIPEEQKPATGFCFYTVEDLQGSFASGLVDKYKTSNDNLRWSLKPVFLLHLLELQEELIYLDCDIFFFADPSFLFRELNGASVLLTPHQASPDPFLHEEKFMMNFLAGLYNAGFIGASRKAEATLKWWASACLYRTEINPGEGFYVDQRYLDLVPIIDPGARLLRHEGCNIGSWNMESRVRVRQTGGAVLINGKFPVVFIHFNHETIRHILNGDDAALKPYYLEYEKAFASTGHRLADFIPKLQEWKHSNFLVRLKRRSSIRTRIKRLLYTIAKKL